MKVERVINFIKKHKVLTIITALIVIIGFARIKDNIYRSILTNRDYSLSIDEGDNYVFECNTIDGYKCQSRIISGSYSKFNGVGVFADYYECSMDNNNYECEINTSLSDLYETYNIDIKNIPDEYISTIDISVKERENIFADNLASKKITIKYAISESDKNAIVTDTVEPKKIVIELPSSYLDEAELGRVKAIVASKASVLKKALETDNLSIERREDKICFPWFTDHGIDGEAKAYMQLVSGIAKRAKMLTRVTATESPSDNDKFTMRLFLVSLNFKGEEYKFARKFLLRNLSGNSSWRTEDAKARHDARKVQREIEAPEVTIGQSSKGGEDHAELPE